MRRKRSRPKNKISIPRFDRNSYIKAPKLRVINSDGENLGVITTEKALSIAREQELDLILINPQAEPPVARIVSWSKFKYDLSKKKKSQKGKTSNQKGMWIKPFIEDGDLNHKISRVQSFLEKGDKVKIEIRPVRGRGDYRQKMKETGDKIQEMVSEFAELETPPKKEGRSLAIYLKPKK